MQLTTIEYKGIQYPARETKEGLIAVSDLFKDMWVSGEGFMDREAEIITKSVRGWAGMKELHLPEIELLNLFK